MVSCSMRPAPASKYRKKSFRILVISIVTGNLGFDDRGIGLPRGLWIVRFWVLRVGDGETRSQEYPLNGNSYFGPKFASPIVYKYRSTLVRNAAR